MPARPSTPATIAAALLTVVLVALVLPTPRLPASTAATTTTCLGDTLPLRLVAGTTSALLTTSSSRASAEPAPHPTDRRVVALTASGAGPGRVSVTRYRSAPGAGTVDYVYVRDAASRGAAESAGYRPDGETLYGAGTPAPGCTQPVYQLVRAAQHQVALGGAAVAALAGQGWRVQATLFHAADPPGRARPVANGPVAQALPANDADDTFSVVVLPDTQEEVHTDADHRLRDRSAYIAERQRSWDIRLAVSVGDIADWDTPDHAHDARAADQLAPLVAAVPFVAAPGNHDSAAVCPGGSACTGLSARTGLRDTTVYNTYFPASRFSLLRGTFEAGRTDNAFHTFRAGGVDWLVLNLELWPRPEVVDWAAGVVAANPRKNVVVVTHSYLTRGGQILGDAGGYGSTSPRYLFDHLVKVYPNVKIVLSGHTGNDAVRVDKGVHGNRIVSYLQCFHSHDANPFRQLSINTRSGEISSTVHTPSTGRHSRTESVKGLAFVR